MPSTNRNEKATCSYCGTSVSKMNLSRVTKNLVLEVQKHAHNVPMFTARRKRPSITTLPRNMRCHIQRDGQSAQVVKKNFPAITRCRNTKNLSMASDREFKTIMWTWTHL